MGPRPPAQYLGTEVAPCSSSNSLSSLRPLSRSLSRFPCLLLGTTIIWVRTNNPTHAATHALMEAGYVADETSSNQAEKRAIGDYYYMGTPGCRDLLAVSAMLTAYRIADETSQAEKRAIGDYYYMGELA